MDELITRLAEQRVKINCDYAVTVKYGKNHLLCCRVFLDRILMVASGLGVEFSTVNTYE